MSEEHVAQPIAAPEPPVRSYEDVLAKHPDMHPDLAEQVQRLAVEAQTEIEQPQEPEEGTMAFLLHETDKQVENLAAATEDIPRTGFPYDTFSVLEKGEYTPEELGELLNKQVAVQEEVQKRMADSTVPAEDLNVRDLLTKLPAVPTETLRALYNAPPELSKGLHTIMRNAEDDHEKYFVLKRLAEIYKVPDVLDLYKPETEASKDSILTHFRQQSGGEVVPLIAFSRHESAWGETPEARSSAKRDWADRYLERVVQLPQASRDDLLFASHSRVSDTDTGLVTDSKMRQMLAKVATTTERLGVKTVEDLHLKAGIVNLDYFSAEQLQLTKDVLDGVPEVIERLKEHDVIVSMADGRGDYNGALSNSAAVYGTKDERTLVFEINQPSDFYRHLLRLEKSGIKPSTIVAGAHGAIGFMDFGKGEKGFNLGKEYFELPITAEIVERFMQDGRGKDEPEFKGLRRIILDACYQGKSGQRPRQSYEKRQKLIHHLTRRGKRDVVDIKESSVQTLARTAKHPSLRVLGATSASSPERERSVLRFRADDRSDSTTPPEFTPIQEAYIDEDGIVHTSQIEQLTIDPAWERAAA
jgi:hypothetical protein